MIHLCGSRVDPSLAHHIVRNEFRERHTGVLIEPDRCIRCKGDPHVVSGIFAGSSIQNEGLELPTRTVTRLVEPNAAVDQGIVHYDLFALQVLSVLHHRQLRPPLAGGTILIVFLARFVTAHREGQNFVASVL